MRLVYQYSYAKVVGFCFELILSTSGRRHFGSLFIDEEQKKLARDVIFFWYTCLLMTSVIQLSGHNMVAHACFCDFQTSTFNKQDEKPSEKLPCVYMYF